MHTPFILLSLTASAVAVPIIRVPDASMPAGLRDVADAHYEARELIDWHPGQAPPRPPTVDGHPLGIFSDREDVERSDVPHEVRQIKRWLPAQPTPTFDWRHPVFRPAFERRASDASPDGTTADVPEPTEPSEGISLRPVMDWNPYLPIDRRVDTSAGLPVFAEAREVISPHADSTSVPECAKSLPLAQCLRFGFTERSADGVSRRKLNWDLNPPVWDGPRIPTVVHRDFPEGEGMAKRRLNVIGGSPSPSWTEPWLGPPIGDITA